jgi:hypothetical protein
VISNTMHCCNTCITVQMTLDAWAMWRRYYGLISVGSQLLYGYHHTCCKHEQQLS